MGTLITTTSTKWDGTEDNVYTYMPDPSDGGQYKLFVRKADESTSEEGTVIAAFPTAMMMAAHKDGVAIATLEQAEQARKSYIAEGRVMERVAIREQIIERMKDDDREGMNSLLSLLDMAQYTQKWFVLVEYNDISLEFTLDGDALGLEDEDDVRDHVYERLEVDANVTLRYSSDGVYESDNCDEDDTSWVLDSVNIMVTASE
jgi:hypothetical protein